MLDLHQPPLFPKKWFVYFCGGDVGAFCNWGRKTLNSVLVFYEECLAFPHFSSLFLWIKPKQVWGWNGRVAWAFYCARPSYKIRKENFYSLVSEVLKETPISKSGLRKWGGLIDPNCLRWIRLKFLLDCPWISPCYLRTLF